MTKKEFIEKLIQSMYGRKYTVEYNGNGQNLSIRDKDGHYVGPWIWADNLKGGRVSIKLKYFEWSTEGLQKANRAAKALWNVLYYMEGSVVDAATRCDVFRGHTSRFGYYYVVRLRCDRAW